MKNQVSNLSKIQILEKEGKLLIYIIFLLINFLIQLLISIMQILNYFYKY